MRTNYLFITFFAAILVLSGCQNEEPQVQIPDFNYPETIAFQNDLSSYDIFEGDLADLKPSSEFHLYELSSQLFTDYAHKQRLIKLPEGKSMSKMSNGNISFPDGTIIVKTFYYHNDERDSSAGRNIIETRLLIKATNSWNIATYQWNENQTEAKLSLNGVDKRVSWISEQGIYNTTLYHLPSQNECMTCHQSNEILTPIGPTVRNLNRDVNRSGFTQNQLAFFHSKGLLQDAEASNDPSIVNYKDHGLSIQERGRAYLDLNCAHCHNPNGWEECAEQGLDFRYETSYDETGINFNVDEIQEVVFEQEMPFIGTTVIDSEGAMLLLEYLQSL